ncbi:hypothetical protein ACVII1_004326 [Bradyrhizobium elkanii]
MAFVLGGEINGNIAPAADRCGASLLIAKDKSLAAVQSLMCGRSAPPRAFAELKGRNEDTISAAGSIKIGKRLSRRDNVMLFSC